MKYPGAAWSLAAALCVTACGPTERIGVTNAWLRPPAPGLAVAAGYFDIINHGAATIDLIGARCTCATSIEMHTETLDGDLMQMRRLDAVALPPGEIVPFAPNGRHLMLFEFSGVTSDRVAITLLFSDGSQRLVPFEMRTVTGASRP